MWDTFSTTLDLPFSPRNAIRHSLNLDKAGKLDKVITYVVKMHPYGSWRLIIWALDEMGRREDAEAIRAYAEPVGMWSGAMVKTFFLKPAYVTQSL